MKSDEAEEEIRDERRDRKYQTREVKQQSNKEEHWREIERRGEKRMGGGPGVRGGGGGREKNRRRG